MAAVLDWARQAASRLGELDGADDLDRRAWPPKRQQLGATVAGDLAAQLTDAAQGQAADALRRRGDHRAGRAGHAVRVAHGPGHAGQRGLRPARARTRWRSGWPRTPGHRRCHWHKGASGGELSRVMLAIEVVFAGADPGPHLRVRRGRRRGGRAGRGGDRPAAGPAGPAWPRSSWSPTCPRSPRSRTPTWWWRRPAMAAVTRSGVTRLDRRRSRVTRAVPDAGRA